MNEETPETRIRHAQYGITRALDNLDRCKEGTHGRTWAKEAMLKHIDDLIKGRIDEAFLKVTIAK